MPDPTRFLNQRDFPLSPSQAWGLLSNTEHLDRTIGLPNVLYGSPRFTAETSYREAAAAVYGMLPMKWKEYPFEWILNRRYAVRREFQSGPIKRFYGGVEFEPSATGTRVCVFADITPRTFWTGPIVSIIGRKGVRDTLNYCAEFLHLKDSGSEHPLPRRGKSHPPSMRLAQALSRISQVPSLSRPLIERLGRHLLEGTDEQVLRMRPFVLADEWEADRELMLRLFLHATREGLLNLAWELMCPNCRVPKAEYGSLKDLDSAFHCDLCGINYEADLDRYTELRFSAHPEVRAALDQVYCIGGPANSPHILLQQCLPAGQTRSFDLDLGGHPLRLRALKYNHSSMLQPQPAAPTELTLTYTNEGWLPPSTPFRPGSTQLHIRNQSSNFLVAVLEKIDRDARAVTAARVTAMQEFRNHFSAEVLAPGKQISISNLCVLFTDLKKSTLLYEQIGDAPAFGRVRRHFDFLLDCVQGHNGALVKTMGDAIMAVFSASSDALQAAIEIQEQVAAFNRSHQIDPPIVIKLGFHQGPVIAVNANDRLDYFGRTVNLASRIQNQSQGNDIVVSHELLQAPELQAILKTSSASITPFQTTLKDIEGPFPLCRIMFNNHP